MMNRREYLSALIGAACLLAGADAGQAAPEATQQAFLTIGTGGITGVYYPAGGAVCRVVNKGRKDHGIRCSVESTEGSIFNVEAIRGGELDMAIVQSDWQFHAYRGTGRFAKAGPDRDLRSVLSLHPESFTVIARADAGVRTFDDLKGKRVNVGNPGSGQRATMDVVLAAKNWTIKDFAAATELNLDDQSEALCAGTVDAVIFTVGHPNGSVKEATTACDSVVVEVAGPEIDALLAGKPYYRHAVIPGGMYRGSPADVATFGVAATLVSSTRLPERVVYTVVKSVFDHFDEFRQLHPALFRLKREDMFTSGITAPLHDGALRYQAEVADRPAQGAEKPAN